MNWNVCTLCPRTCRVNREKEKGFCGCGPVLKVARAALHQWEEPCISGSRGSGTVFFSGCTLKCCFCQNYQISCEGHGKEISVERLRDIFWELQDQGAHNINLVTATQYLPLVLKALDLAKPRLAIPVVYNCGGYERVETIRELKGYVDIYLPDLKYKSPELSAKYSGAADYFAVASQAIQAMTEQTGPLVWDQDGLLKRGVIVRHMVLPGAREDSVSLLQWMAKELPRDSFLISVMSQYTPFYKSSEHREINRRLTSFEYNKVVDAALSLGLDQGFMQQRSSAKEEYTPPFDLEGV